MTAPLGVVLAGGRSRRMGRPKAVLEVDGISLVEHSARALAASVCAGPVVVAKRTTALPDLPYEVWLEPDEPAHPLRGIVTALERARRPVVSVPCDTPFVAVELIDRLAACAGAAVAVGPRGVEPLLARYPTESLGVLAEALGRGEAARDAIARLDPEPIQCDAGLLNVNTPEDLERARSVAGR